ncbi:uncharacterized protein LOC144480955 [Mustelus asterias]
MPNSTKLSLPLTPLKCGVPMVILRPIVHQEESNRSDCRVTENQTTPPARRPSTDLRPNMAEIPATPPARRPSTGPRPNMAEIPATPPARRPSTGPRPNMAEIPPTPSARRPALVAQTPLMENASQSLSATVSRRSMYLLERELAIISLMQEEVAEQIRFYRRNSGSRRLKDMLELQMITILRLQAGTMERIQSKETMMANGSMRREDSRQRHSNQ